MPTLLMFSVGLLSAVPALAAPELITNGNFEQTSLTSSTQFSGTTVTGWSNAATNGLTGYGYNFLSFPGTADTTGFTTLLGLRNRLTGPRGSALNLNSSANGMPTASPAGGNFLISSTDPNTGGAVSQTIDGLVAGQTYALSFYWAAAQFAGTLAATTEFWTVTFGGATQSTRTSSQPVGGFTPWTQQTMVFTASDSRQVLSFLAVSAPGGLAAAAGLLDGVSLMAVPEPGSWTLLLAGLAGTAWWTQRRRRRVGLAGAIPVR